MLEGTGSLPFVVCPDVDPEYPGSNIQVIRNADEPQGLTNPPPPIPQGIMGIFYLKPTCVGSSTVRPFTLLNGSRLPLKYVVNLENSGNGIISVFPLKGILRGNDEIKLMVRIYLYTSLFMSIVYRYLQLIDFVYLCISHD
jgi:hypothetical protein